MFKHSTLSAFIFSIIIFPVPCLCFSPWVLATVLQEEEENYIVSEHSKNVQFKLKWKTRIGLTSYRTTLAYADGNLFVPSNGHFTGSINDNFDCDTG